ncbi:hypothetical protein QBC47DRAFT_418183 [Echria macrotheca]|uniref:Uncharacterized protein n=1 Tax=Echria macrotheca TaxID=438768 RepID=A0AAJ0B6V0_9PEZI|nr:hypothetical protein QBC47DRAFT_418183 [Echria macrotheca]
MGVASGSGEQQARSAAAKKDTVYSTTSLPSWVQEALEDDNLAQPWKSQDVGQDDPNFGEGEDQLQLYNKGVKCCPGEGSLAA